MTADKNPNRKGLECIAKGLGLTLKPSTSSRRRSTPARSRRSTRSAPRCRWTPRRSRKRRGRLELFVVQAIERVPGDRAGARAAARRGPRRGRGHLHPGSTASPSASAGPTRPRARRCRTGSGRSELAQELGGDAAGAHQRARRVPRAGAAQVAELAELRLGQGGPPDSREAGHQPAARRGRRASAGVPRVRRAAGQGNLTMKPHPDRSLIRRSAFIVGAIFGIWRAGATLVGGLAGGVAVRPAPAA